MSIKQTETINKSISRNGFLGFAIMLAITFFMEFVLGGNEPIILIPPWVKFLIYVIMMTLVVIFGVQKPDMMRFLSTVRDALEDGKITADEAVAMIRQGWFVLMGFWADISQIANKEKKVEMDNTLAGEEKKDDPDPPG